MCKRNGLVQVMSFLVIFLGLQWAGAYAQEVYKDADITTTLKDKIAEDKVLSGLDIQVETNKGVVHLRGNIKSSAEASTAVELASATPGVRDVDTSKLYIQGSHQLLTDSLITAKIKGLYVREKILGNKTISVSGVHVETSDGTVYLTGEVDHKSEAENAEKLAKSVKGVKKVKANISVKDK